MGRIYCARQVEPLVGKLAMRLEGLRQSSDPFAAPWLIAPSRMAKSWLQLDLARRHGLCANLKWSYLEKALWDMTALLDTRARQIDCLTVDTLRQMVLSVLLDPKCSSADVGPLRDYLGSPDGGPRTYQRKARQLADRLARSFEDYAFHRADMLADWLTDDAEPQEPIERAQRALYRKLMASGGLRDRLAAESGVDRLTLGEYADALLPVATPAAARLPVMLFGLSHVSPMYVDLLRKLDPFYDFDLYVCTPLAGRSRTVEELMADVERDPMGREPLAAWGRAAVRGLRRMAPLLAGERPMNVNILADGINDGAPAGSLLRAVQERVFGTAAGAASADDTVRVVAAPSIFREAEGVYQDVLARLSADPKLRPGDVAVVVANMEVYRAPLQAAFGADGGAAVPFTLRDVPVQMASHYARGVEQLLELCDSRFPRADVCGLVINPCFIARAAIDRAEAEQWAVWARKLGVCHSFDPAAKAAEGYCNSSAFTWDLAMRRLRLGTLFERTGDGDPATADAFDHAVPYADLESGDSESVGRFCEAVETLHRRLLPLRRASMTATQWRDTLARLFADYLGVPEGDPGEGAMRRQVADSLAALADLDVVRRALGESATCDLALARQHVLDGLGTSTGVIGRRQPGGVTLAQFASIRPLAFKRVYVLGLGEGDFPGQVNLTALDLTARTERATDISLPDLNRELFLDAVLSAREGLWISYVSRDLQKDRQLYRSSVLAGICRYLEESAPAFRVMSLPLTGADPAYLATGSPANFSPYDRAACLLRLSKQDHTAIHGDLTVHVAGLRPDFSAPESAAAAASRRVIPLQVSQLKKFLENPVLAAVQRHLGLRDEDVEPPDDDEPFFSSFPEDWRCQDKVLRQFVEGAIADSVDAAMERLRDNFDRYFAGCQRVGRVPEGVFGEVDRDRVFDKVRMIVGRPNDPDSIHLGRFLRDRQGVEAIASVVIGSGRGPAGAKRMDVLRLPLDANREVHLSGAAGPLFRTEDKIEALGLTTKKKIEKEEIVHHVLQPYLLLLALSAAEPAWAGTRSLVVHLAHGGGLRTFEFPSVPPTQAAAYLASLCTELVDRRSFENLPFDHVVKQWDVADVSAALRASILAASEN